MSRPLSDTNKYLGHLGLWPLLQPLSVRAITWANQCYGHYNWQYVFVCICTLPLPM